MVMMSRGAPVTPPDTRPTRRPLTLADLPAGYRRRGHMEFDEFKRVLIGWPLFLAIRRLMKQRFEEGGGIEHLGVKTEAAWANAVAIYTDVEYYRLYVKARFSERSMTLFDDYWAYQRTYEWMEASRRAHWTQITAAVWDGAKIMAERMTRLPDARQLVDEWKEDQKGKGRDLA